jgi:transposase InsO family protein
MIYASITQEVHPGKHHEIRTQLARTGGDRRLCKLLEVHPSGFYAWRLNPESRRAKEDKRLLVSIKESWLESGSVYGYRKVSDDLRELGEQCGINRLHRLMRSAGIRSQKRKYKRGGAPSLVAPNHQFSSYDWRDFLDEHNLQRSMSRRGNCHDNAVAESFFQLLKRERIRRKTYGTKDDAKQDVFDYIEMFYNPKRRHSFSNDLSSVEYEKQYFQRLASV